MKFITIYVLIFTYCASMTAGFTSMRPATKAPTKSSTKLFINIGDQERDKLTRDSEPGDYFKTWVYTIPAMMTFGSRRRYSIRMYICFIVSSTGIRTKWRMLKNFQSLSQVLRLLHFHFLQEWLLSMRLNKRILSKYTKLRTNRCLSPTCELDENI